MYRTLTAYLGEIGEKRDRGRGEEVVPNIDS